MLPFRRKIKCDLVQFFSIGIFVFLEEVQIFIRKDSIQKTAITESFDMFKTVGSNNRSVISEPQASDKTCRDKKYFNTFQHTSNTFQYISTHFKTVQ
jgi:hypothetical protein